MEQHKIALVVAISPGILSPYILNKSVTVAKENKPVYKEFASNPHKTVVLEGNAGTGKTTTALAIAKLHHREICCATVKQLLGGDTPSMFRKGPGLFYGERKDRSRVDPTDIECVVFEEAWMFTTEIIEELHQRLCHDRHDVFNPFGGINHVVFVGGWHDYTHCFDTETFKKLGYKPSSFECTNTLRFDRTEYDDYSAVLDVFMKAVHTHNDSVAGLSGNSIEFMNRILCRSFPNTLVDCIHLAYTGQNALSCQWKIYNTKKYKASAIIVPAGSITHGSPELIPCAFPVCKNMPIRFTQNVVNSNNDIIVPKGTIATLKDGIEWTESSTTIIPANKRDIVLKISYVNLTGTEVDVSLPPTPFLSNNIEEHFSKRARGEIDADVAVPRKRIDLVPSSTWPFVPAWSLNIADTYNQTLSSRIYVHFFPIISNPKTMSLLYTAMTRSQICLRVRLATSVDSLYRQPPKEESEPSPFGAASKQVS